MTKHFENEIEILKKKILSVSTLVEESVHLAVKAMLTFNMELAQSIIENDEEIDRLEVEVEEDCLKILALYQPVAADLRFVIAVLKLNHDIERIGDLSVSIAHRALTLFELPKIQIVWDFSDMADKVKAMLRKSLECLVNRDSLPAYEVLASDDEVDNINRTMYREIQAAMKKSPETLESLQCLISLSRSLERIADHATNIAEDVIYLVEGKIVRHHRHSSDDIVGGTATALKPKDARKSSQVKLSHIN